MDISSLAKRTMEGNVVLFLGSGFSSLATNTVGTKLLTGRALARKIAGLCSIDPNTDLAIAADMYIEQFDSASMINLLRKEFLIKDAPDIYNAFAKVQWKRIYTTNYDHLIEFVCIRNGVPIVPLTLQSPINQTKHNVCIHINGFINDLNETTLNSSFKLTDKSQTTEFFQNSNWATLFRMDIQSSDAVLFVGFSLNNDLDIKRIIALENINSKCVFIVSKDESNTNITYLKKYGEVLAIGVDGISSQLDFAIKNYVPIQNTNFDEYLFTSFVRHHLSDSIITPKDKIVSDYYVYGIRNNSLNNPNETGKLAIVKRQCVREILNAIDDGKQMILIHGDLGNGKTEISEQVSFLLLNKRFYVFVLNEVCEKTAREIELICTNQKNNLVIIENFFNYTDVLRQFSIHIKDNTRLLLTARTSIYRTKSDLAIEMTGIKPSKVSEFDVNKLSHYEIEDLDRIFTQYGYYSRGEKHSKKEKQEIFTKECKGRLQNILLKFFDSKIISDKFHKVIEEIRRDERSSRITIILILKEILTLDLSFSDIINLCGYSTTIDYSLYHNTAITEIVDITERKMKLKSSVIAKWIIQQSGLKSKVLDYLRSLGEELDKKACVSQKYLNALNNIVSYSHMQFLLKELFVGDKERRQAIIPYYESLKNFDTFKGKYFFWLQYAIASTEVKDFTQAELHFQAAFSCCDNETLVPFEVNNQYARYKLMILLRDTFNAANFVNEITIINSIVVPTGEKGDDERYCFRTVSEYYPKIYNRYKNVILSSFHDEFLGFLGTIVVMISKYQKGLRRVVTSVDDVDDYFYTVSMLISTIQTDKSIKI